jgi:alkanesulfonate monooxygenase SsuD/methylene tetrahydromethanopterin reductase-like flavin-dependent oxidoreductase (luciferase family)
MSLTTAVLLLPTYTANQFVGRAQLAEHMGYECVWLADKRCQDELMAGVRQELAT